MGEHECRRRPAVEGQPARRREPGGDAERVEIAARIAARSLRDFGADVLRRAAHDAVVRRGAREHVRDAEIGHHRAATHRVEQHVVWLHVAVHDPIRMGMRECPRDLLQYAHRLRRGERPGASDALAERLAVDVGHDEEHHVAARVHQVDRNDVRVRECGDRAGLAHEAFACLAVSGEVRREQLDRDESFEREVARQEDDPHAAAPDLAHEREPSGHGLLQCEEFGARTV